MTKAPIASAGKMVGHHWFDWISTKVWLMSTPQSGVVTSPAAIPRKASVATVKMA